MDTRPSPAQDSKQPPKYASPASPQSAMTPPPSSQVAQASQARSSVRTPTPPTPQLSSPPPTQRSGVASYTVEQASNASVEELREMVGELLRSLQNARTSAAHHKLQYEMLCMESSESSNRMEVEIAMAQREVEVLQQADQRRRSNMTSPSESYQEPVVTLIPENAALLNEMSRHCQVLQSENEELRNMLDHTKRSRERRDGEVASLYEANEHLRGRIRKNREHMNTLGLDGVYDMSSPRFVMESGASRNPLTPSRAPRHRGQTMASPPSTRTRDQQPFEALLLADKMLRQDPMAATAPSTPTRSGAAPRGRGRFSHTRNTHSLSSMPSPHDRAATGPHKTVPHTPPTFAAATAALNPQSAPAAHYAKPARLQRRRGESTDSTITASSVEDDVVAEPGTSLESAKDVEIAESSASQMAGEMLRRSGEQRGVPPFAGEGAAAERASPKQSRLFGRVTKPGVKRGPDSHEKRRMSDALAEESGSPAKKGRVGLGIGGLEGRR